MHRVEVWLAMSEYGGGGGVVRQSTKHVNYRSVFVINVSTCHCMMNVCCAHLEVCSMWCDVLHYYRERGNYNYTNTT